MVRQRFARTTTAPYIEGQGHPSPIVEGPLSSSTALSSSSIILADASRQEISAGSPGYGDVFASTRKPKGADTSRPPAASSGTEPGKSKKKLGPPAEPSAAAQVAAVDAEGEALPFTDWVGLNNAVSAHTFQTHVTHLAISSVVLDDDSWIWLCRIIPMLFSVRILDLSNVGMNDDRCRMLIGDFKQGTGLGSPFFGLTRSTNVQLTTIDWCHNELTAKAAPAIGKLLQSQRRCLQFFNLRANKFGNHGLQLLATHLSALYDPPTLVDAGALSPTPSKGGLKRSPNARGAGPTKPTPAALRSLDLSNNRVTARGIVDILTAASVSQCLEHLSLYDNICAARSALESTPVNSRSTSAVSHRSSHSLLYEGGDGGASASYLPREILYGMVCPNNLRTIDLSYCRLGPENAKEIIQVVLFTCSFLSELYVAGNNIDDSIGSVFVDCPKNLEFLNVLDLSKNPIGEETVTLLTHSVVMLEKMRNLETLKFSHCYVKMEGVMSLVRLTAPNLDEAGAPAFPPILPRMRTLDVTYCSLNENECTALREAIQDSTGCTIRFGPPTDGGAKKIITQHSPPRNQAEGDYSDANAGRESTLAQDRSRARSPPRENTSKFDPSSDTTFVVHQNTSSRGRRNSGTESFQAESPAVIPPVPTAPRRPPSPQPQETSRNENSRNSIQESVQQTPSKDGDSEMRILHTEELFDKKSDPRSSTADFSTVQSQQPPQPQPPIVHALTPALEQSTAAMTSALLSAQCSPIRNPPDQEDGDEGDRRIIDDSLNNMVISIQQPTSVFEDAPVLQPETGSKLPAEEEPVDAKKEESKLATEPNEVAAQHHQGHGAHPKLEDARPAALPAPVSEQPSPTPAASPTLTVDSEREASPQSVAGSTPVSVDGDKSPVGGAGTSARDRLRLRQSGKRGATKTLTVVWSHPQNHIICHIIHLEDKNKVLEAITADLDRILHRGAENTFSPANGGAPRTTVQVSDWDAGCMMTVKTETEESFSALRERLKVSTSAQFTSVQELVQSDGDSWYCKLKDRFAALQDLESLERLEAIVHDNHGAEEAYWQQLPEPSILVPHSPPQDEQQPTPTPPPPEDESPLSHQHRARSEERLDASGSTTRSTSRLAVGRDGGDTPTAADRSLLQGLNEAASEASPAAPPPPEEAPHDQSTRLTDSKEGSSDSSSSSGLLRGPSCGLAEVPIVIEPDDAVWTLPSADGVSGFPTNVPTLFVSCGAGKYPLGLTETTVQMAQLIPVPPVTALAEATASLVKQESSLRRDRHSILSQSTERKPGWLVAADAKSSKYQNIVQMGSGSATPMDRSVHEGDASGARMPNPKSVILDPVVVGGGFEASASISDSPAQSHAEVSIHSLNGGTLPPDASTSTLRPTEPVPPPPATLPPAPSHSQPRAPRLPVVPQVQLLPFTQTLEERKKVIHVPPIAPRREPPPPIIERIVARQQIQTTLKKEFAFAKASVAKGEIDLPKENRNKQRICQGKMGKFDVTIAVEWDEYLVLKNKVGFGTKDLVLMHPLLAIEDTPSKPFVTAGLGNTVLITIAKPRHLIDGEDSPDPSSSGRAEEDKLRRKTAFSSAEVQTFQIALASKEAVDEAVKTLREAVAKCRARARASARSSATNSPGRGSSGSAARSNGSTPPGPGQF